MKQSFAHSIWTNPEADANGIQCGYIGSALPVDQWKGSHLVFQRPDGSGICFPK